MLVTLSGIVSPVILVLKANASPRMPVTPSGMTTSPEQAFPSMSISLTTTSGFSCFFASSHGVCENALLPMLVTLSGIAASVRAEQPENALLPMLVTLSAIVISVRPSLS